MKTTLIGTALIAALLAGAASAGTEFGAGQITAPALADTISTSGVTAKPGDRVTIPGTNATYIHDATNASADEPAAPNTPAERLALIMN